MCDRLSSRRGFCKLQSSIPTCSPFKSDPIYYKLCVECRALHWARESGKQFAGGKAIVSAYYSSAHCQRPSFYPRSHAAHFDKFHRLPRHYACQMYCSSQLFAKWRTERSPVLQQEFELRCSKLYSIGLSGRWPCRRLNSSFSGSKVYYT